MIVVPSKWTVYGWIERCFSVSSFYMEGPKEKEDNGVHCPTTKPSTSFSHSLSPYDLSPGSTSCNRSTVALALTITQVQLHSSANAIKRKQKMLKKIKTAVETCVYFSETFLWSSCILVYLLFIPFDDESPWDFAVLVNYILLQSNLSSFW